MATFLGMNGGRAAGRIIHGAECPQNTEAGVWRTRLNVAELSARKKRRNVAAVTPDSYGRGSAPHPAKNAPTLPPEVRGSAAALGSGGPFRFPALRRLSGEFRIGAMGFDKVYDDVDDKVGKSATRT